MGDKPATADPTKNLRHQQNVFEKEVILSEKEKLRLRLVNDKEAMKEVCYQFVLYFNQIATSFYDVNQ